MILDEENLEGEITGLGFANPVGDDGTTAERLGVLVFLDDPMLKLSNLLRSKPQGWFTTEVLRRFLFEFSPLTFLDLWSPRNDFLLQNLEIIWTLATVHKLIETPTLPKGYGKKNIIIHREPKARFHKGNNFLASTT